MSAMADAYMMAIERAFPKLDGEEYDRIFEAWMEELLPPAAREAIQRQLDGITPADIER